MPSETSQVGVVQYEIGEVSNEVSIKLASVQDFTGDIRAREESRIGDCKKIINEIPVVIGEADALDILVSNANASFDLESKEAMKNMPDTLPVEAKLDLLRRLRSLSLEQIELMETYGKIDAEDGSNPGFRPWLTFRNKRDHLIRALVHADSGQDLNMASTDIIELQKSRDEDKDLYSKRIIDEMSELGRKHGENEGRVSVNRLEQKFVLNLLGAYDLSSPLDYEDLSEHVRQEYGDQIQYISEQNLTLVANKQYLERNGRQSKQALFGSISQKIQGMLDNAFDSDFFLSEVISTATDGRGDPLWSASGFITNSAEKVALIRQIGLQLEHSELVNDSIYAKIQAFLSQEQIVEQANEELGRSERTLWYASDIDTMTSSILPGMKIESRAVQMKKHNLARFNSARLMVEKDNDQYIVTDTSSGKTRTLTEVELESVRGLGNKTWYQEYHQICFEPDRPYMYANDCAVVFPRGEIMVDAQFATMDGLHVFDKDFNGKMNSPGMEVDLNIKKYLVVVNKEIKDDFISRLRTSMGNLADDFINNHVIFANNLHEVETIRMVNQAVGKLVTDRGNVRLIPHEIHYEKEQVDHGKDLIFAKSIVP